MSDAEPVDLQAHLARIDLAIARIEQRQADIGRLIATLGMRHARASTRGRDWLMAPWIGIAAMIGGMLGLISFATELLLRP